MIYSILSLLFTILHYYLLFYTIFYYCHYFTLFYTIYTIFINQYINTPILKLTNLAFDFSSMKDVEFKVSYRGKDEIHKMDLSNYDDMNIDSRIKANLKKMLFTKMTPIQEAVIPHLSDGYDVMGCSQTGSGKTAAFLLPIINKMLKEGPPDNDTGSNTNNNGNSGQIYNTNTSYGGLNSYGGGYGNNYGYNHSNHNQGSSAKPIALVLIPTRELADQIFKEARKIVHKTGIQVVKVYGAVGKEHQLRYILFYIFYIYFDYFYFSSYIYIIYIYIISISIYH